MKLIENYDFSGKTAKASNESITEFVGLDKSLNTYEYMERKVFDTSYVQVCFRILDDLINDKKKLLL